MRTRATQTAERIDLPRSTSANELDVRQALVLSATFSDRGW